MRPSKLSIFMKIAETVAERSHDAETHVGAVLVNENNAIIATGHNGFVRGGKDKKLPNTRPEKYKYMVHAEANVVAHCAREGMSMKNCTLICTHSPCVVCMRLLFQCGIKTVVVKQMYKDFEDLMKMKDIKINQESTPEGFVRLTYEVK